MSLLLCHTTQVLMTSDDSIRNNEWPQCGINVILHLVIVMYVAIGTLVVSD